VDGLYKGYDDHLFIQVNQGSHIVRGEELGYHSDQELVSCWNGEIRRVDLQLEEIEGPEETEVIIISTDVDPDRVCEDDDRTIELSARVKLEEGDDNTLVTVRFYIEDDDGDWDYIGSDNERLDEDETRTFDVNYYYDSYELDIGSHRVKVVAEADGDEDIDYDYLYIRDCDDDYDDYNIDVKGIILDPEFPRRCEAILVTTPIELKEAPDFPQDVYIRVYIDGVFGQSSTMKYYYEETKLFRFSIDTCSIPQGTHSIRVEARVDGVSDSSYKSFTITDDYYDDYKTHCLDIEKIWTNKLIQPDEDVRVYVKVTNCGTETESVRANLEAFGIIRPDGMFNLPKDGSREVMFNLHVPEGAAGTESFVARAWSGRTSDVLVKDFIVYTGFPIIDIEPVHEIKKGKTEKIEFDVINAGGVTDTFTLELSGYASNWMMGLPPQITLESGQRKTVEVYAHVPNEVTNGDYQFTVAAEGSPRYAVTSTLRVVEGFKWPSFNLTGLFAGVGLLVWLPWLLLLLLLILLLLFLIWLFTRKGTSRKGGPERTVKDFFKFDDCC